MSRKPSPHEWCDRAAPQMPLWCCTHVCWVCNQRMLCISTRPLTLSASLPSFFLEKNMFVFFLNILRQKSGRYVCVQLLQTLNILFENISHETSLCKDGPDPGLDTTGCRCASCAMVFLLLCECLCSPCVLVCLGCQRACSRLGSLDDRIAFSYSACGWQSTITAAPGLASGEACLPGSHRASLSLCPTCSLLCARGERILMSLPFLVKTLVLDQSPIL